MLLMEQLLDPSWLKIPKESILDAFSMRASEYTPAAQMSSPAGLQPIPKPHDLQPLACRPQDLRFSGYAIASCEALGQWPLALDLMGEMREAEIEPKEMIYGHLASPLPLSLCEVRWRRHAEQENVRIWLKP